jgi:hypothetical protein
MRLVAYVDLWYKAEPSTARIVGRLTLVGVDVARYGCFSRFANLYWGHNRYECIVGANLHVRCH